MALRRGLANACGPASPPQSTPVVTAMPSRARCLFPLLILLASGAGPLALARAEAPSAPIPADLLAGGLVPGETGRVVEIVDGDTLVLAEGRQVRLVGIQAPKLPFGRPDFKAWPLAEAAKAALSELTLGQGVTLAYGGRRIDRHGRALAHVFDTAGTWVQGEILSRGLARVYSFADNRALIPEMLARERAARAARRGIWAWRFYAVREPERLDRHLGGFELVEGRVLKVAVVRKRVYLNFGADWRSDFTVTIAPRTRRLFEAQGIDPHAYEGRILRVRGWLKSYNGPMIEASHPEQIEVIEE
jgi:endonuclease YncB( thermonuclease family)